MIQDDDNKVLSRLAQQYESVKKGGVTRVIWQIINRDVIKYDNDLKEMYFYYHTKNPRKIENYEPFEYFTIKFPPEYTEKLQSMSKDSIDTDVINELVDLCIQELLKILETEKDYDFFDIIPEPE